MKPIFGIHHSRSSNFNDQGTITLGGVDKSKFKGKITFYNHITSNNGFWQIALDVVFVNNKPVGLREKHAIIDTGSTLMLITLIYEI